MNFSRTVAMLRTFDIQKSSDCAQRITAAICSSLYLSFRSIRSATFAQFATCLSVIRAPGLFRKISVLSRTARRVLAADGPDVFFVGGFLTSPFVGPTG